MSEMWRSRGVERGFVGELRVFYPMGVHEHVKWGNQRYVRCEMIAWGIV